MNTWGLVIGLVITEAGYDTTCLFCIPPTNIVLSFPSTLFLAVARVAFYEN